MLCRLELGSLLGLYIQRGFSPGVIICTIKGRHTQIITLKNDVFIDSTVL